MVANDEFGRNKFGKQTNLGEAAQDSCTMIYQLVWKTSSLEQEKDKFCKALYNIYQFFQSNRMQGSTRGKIPEMDNNFPE